MINYNTTLSNKEIDKIETKEETKEIKDNNTLAIMIKGKNETEYKPSESNTWPTGDYKYAGSLCIGNDGREIKESEVISFNNDNHTATITTKDTIYCYLYFVEGEDAVTRILSKSGNTLEAEGDVTERGDVLRRFQGTAEEVQNNYICFGTSITEECTKNTDRYMYRIIGYATEDDDNTNTKYGQLKLIKKEALNKTYLWWVNYDDNIEWPSSLIYANITTDAYLQNEYYVPSGWENKIANHTLLYGDLTISYPDKGTEQLGSEIFKIENGKKASYYFDKSSKEDDGLPRLVVENTIHKGETIYYKEKNEVWTKKLENEKVSLMTVSDYYLSVSKDIICDINSSSKQYPNCLKGWIHLNNNDTAKLSSTAEEPPAVDENIMPRGGYRTVAGAYNSFAVRRNGSLENTAISYEVLSIRPVIYTTENLSLNGSGTIEDPFIIVS